MCSTNSSNYKYDYACSEKARGILGSVQGMGFWKGAPAWEGNALNGLGALSDGTGSGRAVSPDVWGSNFPRLLCFLALCLGQEDACVILVCDVCPVGGKVRIALRCGP